MVSFSTSWHAKCESAPRTNVNCVPGYRSLCGVITSVLHSVSRHLLTAHAPQVSIVSPRLSVGFARVRPRVTPATARLSVLLFRPSNLAPEAFYHGSSIHSHIRHWKTEMKVAKTD